MVPTLTVSPSNSAYVKKDEVSWLVPNKILLVQQKGVISSEGTDLVFKTLIKYLDETKGKVHIISDLQFVENLVDGFAKILSLESYRRMEEHPNLGVQAVVNCKNGLLRTLIRMSSVIGQSARYYDSIEEAKNDLSKY